MRARREPEMKLKETLCVKATSAPANCAETAHVLAGEHAVDERVDAAGDHVADRHADEDGRNLHEHVFKREVLEQPLDHAREALGRRGDDVLRTIGEFRDVHAGVGQIGRNRLSHCCCSV